MRRAVQLGYETRSPFVVAPSDGAVKDSDVGHRGEPTLLDRLEARVEQRDGSVGAEHRVPVGIDVDEIERIWPATIVASPRTDGRHLKSVQPSSALTLEAGT